MPEIGLLGLLLLPVALLHFLRGNEGRVVSPKKPLFGSVLCQCEMFENSPAAVQDRLGSSVHDATFWSFGKGRAPSRPACGEGRPCGNAGLGRAGLVTLAERPSPALGSPLPHLLHLARRPGEPPGMKSINSAEHSPPAPPLVRKKRRGQVGRVLQARSHSRRCRKASEATLSIGCIQHNTRSDRRGVCHSCGLDAAWTTKP